MFCSKCGNQIPDNTAFCSNCGNAVNTQAAPVAETPVAEPVAAPVAEPVAAPAVETPVATPVAEPTYAAPTYQAPQPTYTAPAYNATPAADNSTAILVKGIVALACACSFYFSFVGIIFGCLTKNEVARFLSNHNGQVYGKAKIGSILGKVGLILGIVMTAIFAIWIFCVIITAAAASV